MTSSWPHGRPLRWGPEILAPFPGLCNSVVKAWALLVQDNGINWEEESFESLPAIIIIIAVVLT